MKKQRGHEAQPATLELIREAMRMELGRNRDELNQAVATVRDEVALFGQRVDSIESGVTKQMDTTNKMLSIITSNHDKQTEAVSQIREEQHLQAESMKTFREGQDHLEHRLTLLENKLRGTSAAANSTADTDAPRRPALILGGWPDDQAASDTLNKAKDILRQLDVPLDFSDMFVAGLKRGYAIIPLVQKWGETEDVRREQVQTTLQKVRYANVMLVRGPDGQHRKLWMSMSQSPERRRKAKSREQCWKWGAKPPSSRWNFLRGGSGMEANGSAAPPWTCQRRGSQLVPVGFDWTLWQEPSTGPWLKFSWCVSPGRRSCAETSNNTASFTSKNVCPLKGGK